MRVPYHSMEVNVPFDEIQGIEYFELKESLNNHSIVRIKFLMDEDKIRDILMQMDGTSEILITEENEVGEDKTIFCGKAVRFFSKKEKGLCYLWTEFSSHTLEWDLTSKSQSFCRLAQPYSEVMNDVLAEYSQKDIKDEISNGSVIQDMLLQYEETDWEFLIRMASHFHSFMVVDSSVPYGRAYFGIPDLNYGVMLHYGEYQISRSQSEYDRISLNSEEYAEAEILPQELSTWRIQCRKQLHIAESLSFNGIEVVVTDLNIHTEKGELVREYELKRKSGILCNKKKNPKIYGMSIPATVKERSGNRIRVQMDINQNYESGDDQKYFTYAIESSSIYCMPEENSRVHIYFPSHDEADAIAVHAISTGGGGGRNPSDKSFTTPAGMKMNMKQDEYCFDTGASSLSIGIDGAFKLIGKSIQFVTPTKFSVGEENVPVNIAVEAETECNFSIGDTNINMTDEAHIVAAFIAHVAEIKAEPTPSAAAIEDAVKANDSAIMDEVNGNAEAYLTALGAKRSQAKAQVRHGIFDLIGTALVIGVVVATGGIAAAPIAAIVAVTATNRVMADVSEIKQGATDWEKANRGDLSRTENMFQSALGLSDEQYKTFMAVNNMVFDVVTMSAASVNISNMAFKGISNCTVKALAKGASMMTVNVGKSAIDQFAQTGKVDPKTLAINAGIGFVAGGLGGFAGNGSVSLARYFGLKVSSGGAIALRAIGSGVVGGSTDSIMRSALLGEELTWESVMQSVGLYGAGSALSDVTTDVLNKREPINVALGAFLVNEIDLAIPDIREPVLWERSYSSANLSSGILGRGWSVPFEGRLYQEESGRLHVKIPNGALVFFEWKGDGYQEIGKIKGRYGLKCDPVKMVWSLIDYHTHQIMQYDEKGRFSALCDRNNQQTMLFYQNGQLDHITTSLGHQLHFEFSGNKLIKVSDETGRTVKYRYDGDMLTEVINTAGGRFLYEYSEAGKLTKATDPTGLTYLNNQYDDNGRVCSQVLWDGDACRLEYGDSGDETAIYTKEGTTIYQYTKEKMPLRIIYPDNTDICIRYNENNCCIYRKDRLGNEQYWDYDSYTRIIFEKKPSGLEVHYEYNPDGDLVKVWDNSGTETVYLYDACHQMIEKRELRDKEKQQWDVCTYAYDSMGRLIKKTSPSGKSVSYSYESGYGKPSYTVYEDGESVRREYDLMERMMVKEDSCGSTEYGYNTRDDISLIRDGDGNETMRLYDSVGRLLYLYPPKADRQTGEGATRYRYNFMRHLEDIIYSDGSHEKTVVDWEGTVLKRIHPNAYDSEKDDGAGEVYDYNSDKKLIRIHYPDGGTERFFRDAAGNCIKHVLPEDYDLEKDDGRGYCYTYDAENRLTQVTNPDGIIELVYHYDLRGNVISEQSADGSTAYYWYDLLNQMIQKAEAISDKQGEVFYRRTCYVYDKDGNRIKEYRYGGSWRLVSGEPENSLELEQDGQDLCLVYTYDARNRLICVKDGYGACIRYSYDIRGNRISEEQKINEEVSKKITYVYNRGDRLVEKREVIDSGFADTSKNGKATSITRFKRDPNGNITEIQTPEGYQILREYDVRDRLICERVIDERNSIHRSTSIVYDRAGNVVSIRRKGADTENYEIAYDYDLKDRLIRAKDVEGAVFEYLYDKNNRLIKEYRPSAQAGNSLLQYTYDSQGRLIEKKNAYGHTVEKNSYDSMGRQVMQRLADGEELSFRYGIDGQVENITSETSRCRKKSLQEYRYNSRGQIIGLVDGNGHETGYELDAWGNIRNIKAADGGNECYTYDYAGNITSTTDANGGTIIYRYNSQGKVCEVIDQEGHSERFYYDREGRMTLSIDRLGNRMEIEYNVDGNPVREISCDCDGKHREVRSWEYDTIGHLKKSVGGGFCYQYEYRPDGKLLRKLSGGRPILTCTYYPDGSLKTMTDVTGKPLFYRYDLEGNLSSIADESGQEIVSYQHTAGGKLKTILHQSGIRTDYGYDTAGNLTHLQTRTAAGGILCDLEYEYDLNGNRTAKRGTVALPDGSGQIKSQLRSIRYTYDSMSRLLSETEGGREDRYSYDLCGNRLEKVSGGERESYVYNSKNQLTERRNGTGSWRYVFDPQGNFVRESGPQETLRYEYNPRNQQSKVYSGNHCIQENLYDGENLRAGMTEHGRQSTFLFMNREIVAELNASDTLEFRFIRGYGAAALEYAGKQYGIHHDEQLSTGWITDADGTVENVYEYDAFGNLLRSQGTVPNRLLYGGQQYDLEVGQYYLRARYYNPVVGRFTQEDPYRGDGLNLYAYCANNPVTYYDPSGYVCNFNAQAEENAVRENATLQADGADGTQGGTDDVSWKNGWRTPDGKFASPNGEQKAGAWAEQDVWNSIKQKEGWSVIEGRVYTTDNTGQVRVYDGVAVTPDGHFIGLEVKSGNATKTTAQKAFDNRIGISNPATGIGKSKGITITHTVTIRR